MPSKTWTIALLTVGVAALAGCTSTPRDPYQLKVGQCLVKADDSGLVEAVDPIDCSEPHAAEVFASLTAEGNEYPGRDKLQEQAAGCAPKFEEFIGKPYTQSDLKITYFHPTEESWKQGDRQILCIASVPTGTVTSSLKGSSR